MRHLRNSKGTAMKRCDFIAGLGVAAALPAIARAGADDRIPLDTFAR